MQTRKNTITIGIPAFNEEANITQLLKALTLQKTTSRRKIIEIILLSDGSTDGTVSEARAVKDIRITIVEEKSRKGKNERLNEIFNRFNGDVLVTLDADIILDGAFVIDELTKNFMKSKNVGLVAGNAQPVVGKTIFEDASNNFIASLNFMKDRVKKGQNIYSVRGPILAISKDFSKKLSLPLDVPEDRYLYFMCKRYGFEFVYTPDAKIYFRSPKTFSDQIRQCKRFRADRNALDKYITQKELTEAYFLPRSLKVQAMIFQLIRNPIAYIVMKAIQIYDHLGKREVKKAVWDIAKSTKSFL